MPKTVPIILAIYFMLLCLKNIWCIPTFCCDETHSVYMPIINYCYQVLVCWPLCLMTALMGPIGQVCTLCRNFTDNSHNSKCDSVGTVEAIIHYLQINTYAVVEKWNTKGQR